MAVLNCIKQVINVPSYDWVDTFLLLLDYRSTKSS